jgi:hypothetical protein
MMSQDANTPLDNRWPSDGADKALVQPEASKLPAVLLSEPICPVDGPIPSEGRNPLPSPLGLPQSHAEPENRRFERHLKALKR